METKVRGLRRLGVDVLVSAQTDAERVECDLVDQARVVADAGIRFVCFPIEDRTVVVVGWVVVGDGWGFAWGGLAVISEARGFPVPDTGEQEEWWAGWREGRFHVKP